MRQPPKRQRYIPGAHSCSMFLVKLEKLPVQNCKFSSDSSLQCFSESHTSNAEN